MSGALGGTHEQKKSTSGPPNGEESKTRVRQYSRTPDRQRYRSPYVTDAEEEVPHNK